MISPLNVLLLAVLLLVAVTEEAQGLECYTCTDCTNNAPVASKCSPENGIDAVGCFIGKSPIDSAPGQVRNCFYPSVYIKCVEGQSFPTQDPGKDRCVNKTVEQTDYFLCLSLNGGVKSGKAGELDPHSPIRADYCVCKKDLCNNGDKIGEEAKKDESDEANMVETCPRMITAVIFALLWSILHSKV